MIFRLVLAAFVLCAAVTSGAAATITVTNLADSGPGSLRQAILDANASPLEDAINFQSGLEGPGARITLSSPLIITGSATNWLRITGPSEFLLGRIEVSGNNANPVFVIQSGVVSIISLRVLQGRANGAFPSGGAIYSSGSSLTLDSVSVTQSSAGLDGGGIFIGAGALTMSNSTVTGNNATRDGGGIALDVNTSATITNSQISQNQLLAVNETDGGGGGGIALAGAGPGTGAALLTLTNSTVTENSTSAGKNGGGIAAGTGSVVMLERALLVRNTATGNGGGLAARAANLTITNSFIDGNSAQTGGGIYRDFQADAPAGSIVYSTIAKNTAAVSGGGIASGTVNPISIRGTIIADNTAPDGPDILGSVLSQGYNLFESLSGATITGPTTGNITNLDPLLGPISGTGGILVLNVGSPAIDAGDPSNFTATDYRGAPRPSDGDGNGTWLPDIGAFERTLGTVHFNRVDTYVAENIAGGLARITIERDGADGDMTVQYTVSNGSAVLGSDYQAASGTFTFSGGANTGTISFPIVNDSIIESDETVIINLTSATPGARIGSPATAVVTIMNDDRGFSVSGRVMTPTGQGLRNATVQLVNAQGAITTTTSSFGTYSFENVSSSGPYTVRVISKRYRFAPRTEAFQASATNINFTALE
jgi:hypothetical protein